MTLDPAALRPAYARFLRPGRILMTGHSHQAWPDVTRAAMVEAFDDAAELVDDKWGRAEAAADAVRAAVADRIGARRQEIALGSNTHDLLLRFLSALDLRRRPHLVTTSGEFHTIYRQLRRLEEEGLEVTWVPVAPRATLAERLAGAVRRDTGALLASTVLFEDAAVVPHLEVAVAAAQRVGAEVLLDTYHHFQALPLTWSSYGRDPLWLVGGGYKYAQWGEGCCFLRVPTGTDRRPVITGWFADFANLAEPRGGPLGYGATEADRFTGSTYDPVSHYRARAVDRFFREQGMTPEALRALSLRQTARILDGLDGLEVVTPRAPEARGGFVAVRVDGATEMVQALRERGIFTDARGDLLRLGPAPYVTDDEIDAATTAVRELAASG
ncbi:MAG: aminotransferase class V-fold PLP-dependent enzyme [Sandaracinaceae bacterium]